MYREAFPEGTKEAIKEVDKFYPSYLTVVKAANAAQGAGGVFTPKELTAASKAIGDWHSGGHGENPLKWLSHGGESALNATGDAQELLGMGRKFMQLSPSLTPLQAMGEGVKGQLPLQRGAVAALDNPLIKALRSPITGGRVGAALEE
jgi:hypothetical protein